MSLGATGLLHPQGIARLINPATGAGLGRMAGRAIPARRDLPAAGLRRQPVPATLADHPPAVPAFRKLDAVAVLTARLLPAPQSDGGKGACAPYQVTGVLNREVSLLSSRRTAAMRGEVAHLGQLVGRLPPRHRRSMTERGIQVDQADNPVRVLDCLFHETGRDPPAAQLFGYGGAQRNFGGGSGVNDRATQVIFEPCYPGGLDQAMFGGQVFTALRTPERCAYLPKRERVRADEHSGKVDPGSRHQTVVSDHVQRRLPRLPDLP